MITELNQNHIDSIHTDIDLQDKELTPSTGFTTHLRSMLWFTFMARQHKTCNKTIKMIIQPQTNE